MTRDNSKDFIQKEGSISKDREITTENQEIDISRLDFILDEAQELPNNTWDEMMKFISNNSSRVKFISAPTEKPNRSRDGIRTEEQ